LSGALAAGPLHFLLLKGRDKIDSWPPRAVDCSRGMALPDQLGGAPIKSLTELDTESPMRSPSSSVSRLSITRPVIGVCVSSPRRTKDPARAPPHGRRVRD
jgi:hypothetical protein